MKCKSSYWKRPSCARTIKWDRKTGNECYVLFLIHFRHVLTAKINQLINRLSLVFSRQNLRVQKCWSVERNFVLIRLFCFLTYTICYYKNKDTILCRTINFPVLCLLRAVIGSQWFLVSVVTDQSTITKNSKNSIFRSMKAHVYMRPCRSNIPSRYKKAN